MEVLNTKKLLIQWTKDPANVSAQACICRIKKIIMMVSRNAIHFKTNGYVNDVKKSRNKLIRRTWG